MATMSYPSIVFALRVMGFGVAERLVVGWFHHKQGPTDGDCGDRQGR
jgi:hypothetical protein